jgi:hypothetical protein
MLLQLIVLGMARRGMLWAAVLQVLGLGLLLLPAVLRLTLVLVSCLRAWRWL